MEEKNPVPGGDVLLENPPSQLQFQAALRCVSNECVKCSSGDVCEIVQVLYRRHWGKQVVVYGSWRIPWIERDGKCTLFSGVRPDGKRPDKNGVMRSQMTFAMDVVAEGRRPDGGV